MASVRENLKRSALRARGIRPVDPRWRSLLCGLLGAPGAASLFGTLPAGAPPSRSPIHFVFRPIDYTLDSCETPERHAPETMAGGVAVFDFDNDGLLTAHASSVVRNNCVRPDLYRLEKVAA